MSNYTAPSRSPSLTKNSEPKLERLSALSAFFQSFTLPICLSEQSEGRLKGQQSADRQSVTERGQVGRVEGYQGKCGVFSA